MEIADYQAAMKNQTYSALMERHNVYMMRPDIFDGKAVRQAMIFQSKKASKEPKCKGRNKIAMDCLRCQDAQVKSSTSDKKPIVAGQGRIQVNVPQHLRKDQASI